MRLLVACEFSGVVRRAFKARGHDAWSCDLLESDDGSPNHITGDVRPLLKQRWDAIIAHPDCTRITNAGVRWLHERNLWAEMDDACAFFRLFLEADCDRICVENPIPHKYALERIGQKYTQIIHPWQHGHGETKATCLWLKNLSNLVPSKIVSGREHRIHKMPPGPDRAKERSRTYDGIGRAMANQWG